VPHRLAPPGGDADAAGERGADLGAVQVVLQRRKRPFGEVAVGADRAPAIDEGDPPVIPPSEAVHRRPPGERVAGHRLADQQRVAFQRVLDVADEVPP
jgi:hypothetical protein